MSEERMKILQLLADGKVTAEQASELLAATSNGSSAEKSAETPSAKDVNLEVETLKSAESADFPDDNTILITESDLDGEKATKISFQDMDRPDKVSKPRWLRIRVTDRANDRNKVRIDIPFGLVRFGMRIGQRFSPEIDGIEWNEIEEMVSLASSGLMVNVEDEDEHVQIYVE